MLVRCDDCAASYKLPDDKAGRKFRCKKCGAVVLATPTPASDAPGAPSSGPDRADANLYLTNRRQKMKRLRSLSRDALPSLPEVQSARQDASPAGSDEEPKIPASKPKAIGKIPALPSFPPLKARAQPSSASASQAPGIPEAEVPESLDRPASQARAAGSAPDTLDVPSEAATDLPDDEDEVLIDFQDDEEQAMAAFANHSFEPARSAPAPELPASIDDDQPLLGSFHEDETGTEESDTQIPDDPILASPPKTEPEPEPEPDPEPEPEPEPERSASDVFVLPALEPGDAGDDTVFVEVELLAPESIDQPVVMLGPEHELPLPADVPGQATPAEPTEDPDEDLIQGFDEPEEDAADNTEAPPPAGDRSVKAYCVSCYAHYRLPQSYRHRTRLKCGLCDGAVNVLEVGEAYPKPAAEDASSEFQTVEEVFDKEVVPAVDLGTMAETLDLPVPEGAPPPEMTEPIDHELDGFVAAETVEMNRALLAARERSMTEDEEPSAVSPIPESLRGGEEEVDAAPADVEDEDEIEEYDGYLDAPRVEGAEDER